MLLALLLSLSLFVASDPVQDPAHENLRAALDAMRDGQPGEAAFDDALPYLSDLIRSRSTWWVASSAWLVGEHQLRARVPDLLDALHHENRRERDKVGVAKGHLLDALLRLEVDVPTTLLIERVEQPTLAETYLLLARRKEPDVAALFAVMDAAPTDHGAHHAAACLLASRDAPGLARRLFASEPFPVRVTVRDPGASLVTYGRGGGGSYSMSPHHSWPPRVDWDVLPPGPTDALTAATGKRQSAKRTLRGRKRIRPADRLALRARLFDHLLGACDERGRVGEELDLAMHWRSPAEYERALRAHLDGVRDLFGRIAQRLAALGKLSDPEGALEAAFVDVEIRDERFEGGAPLPDPPGLYWVKYVE